MNKIISVFYLFIIPLIANAQAPDSWLQKQNFGGAVRRDAASFSIGTSGYVATGDVGGSSAKDLWEYNSITNQWTQKSSLGNGLGRSESIGFSIGKKGYMGTGINGPTCLNDFWEYDPGANTWTQKANFGGTARWGTSGFSIGNKGYIGTGIDCGINYLTDFWEYDPASNTWAQKSSLSVAMPYVTGFSIGNKGYMGDKYGFYEYDPSLNTWIQKASYPGMATYQAPGFCIGGKGYIGTGESEFTGGFYSDFWEYNPVSNTWIQRSDFPGTPRRSAIGFCIGTKGYIGLGFDTIAFTNDEYDIWEYVPICSIPVSTIYFSGNITFCNGDSVFLYANNGYNYQWKKNGVDITGATSYFYHAKATGSYTCYLTNSCGAVTSSAISVTVNTLPSATITPSGSTTFCSGGSVTLNAPVAANRTYQWKKGANLISGATLSSYTATVGGNYKVIVTNTVTGCSKTTASATVVTVNGLPTATITPQGPTTFCAGGNVILQANTGTGFTYKWKKNNVYISGATQSSYTATTAGIYKTEVTKSNGCSKTSAIITVTVPCREGETISAATIFNVAVFPNPSSGDFTFEFENASEEKISIHVYDVMGKLVLAESIHNSTFIIHNSKLSPGVYSAVITNGENKKITRLVKTN